MLRLSSCWSLVRMAESGAAFVFGRREPQRSNAMINRRMVFALSVLLLASSATPGMAQDYWYRYWQHSPRWRAVTGGIYQLENRIAFLEANPDIDDGYK